MRLSRTFVALLRKQPKRLSHAVIVTTIFRVGIQSVNPSTQRSSNLLRERTQIWLLQLYLPNLTGSRGVNFSHYSRKVWSILNNLSGRSPHSFRYCLVLADAIASQLVKNGRYEVADRKSYRLVYQEAPDFGGPQQLTQ